MLSFASSYGNPEFLSDTGKCEMGWLIIGAASYDCEVGKVNGSGESQ